MPKHFFVVLINFLRYIIEEKYTYHWESTVKKKNVYVCMFSIRQIKFKYRNTFVKKKVKKCNMTYKNQ